MRADDDVIFLAVKVRVTTSEGVVAEGECVAVDGRIVVARARQTIIEFARTSAHRWELPAEYAS